ncbi:MAG TPA: FTR1 family protein [Anaerolineales bacterium]|nr:FTR1 family protein [Anaerolineales bacterium]
MLPTYLLSLREGLEAALIIGIVLGAINKIRRKDLSPAVWLGALSAVGVSILTAIILTSFGMSLEDPAEAIFEGITMLIAAGILTWMIFWMSKQARFLKSELEAGVNKAAESAGKSAVFWLAFVAVVREGVELALFITAAFFAGNQGGLASNIIQTLAGTILGVGTAVLLSWTLFATTVRLDLRRFFQVTGFLLILFAAGLIAHGVHEFNDARWIPSVIEHVWNLDAVISESSLLGQLLKTLFGYSSAPSLTEMIAYFGYLAVVIVLWRRDTAPVKAVPGSQTSRA